MSHQHLCGIGLAASLFCVAATVPANGQGGAQPAAAAVDPPSGPLANGMLAVPGAAQQSETVPSKYSAQNAAADRLPILAYTFKNLTDAQRAAIYRSVAAGKSGAQRLDQRYAAIAAELPPFADVKPLPEAVTNEVQETRGFRYALAGDSLLLVEPNDRFVAAVIKP
jgi:hypothetical protein